MSGLIFGYCVKCSGKRELVDGHEVRFPLAGGKSCPAMKGMCGTCGASMFKIFFRSSVVLETGEVEKASS